MIAWYWTVAIAFGAATVAAVLGVVIAGVLNSWAVERLEERAEKAEWHVRRLRARINELEG